MGLLTILVARVVELKRFEMAAIGRLIMPSPSPDKCSEKERDPAIGPLE